MATEASIVSITHNNKKTYRCQQVLANERCARRTLAITTPNAWTPSKPSGLKHLKTRSETPKVLGYASPYRTSGRNVSKSTNEAHSILNSTQPLFQALTLCFNMLPQLTPSMLIGYFEAVSHNPSLVECGKLAGVIAPLRMCEFCDPCVVQLWFIR